MSQSRIKGTYKLRLIQEGFPLSKQPLERLIKAMDYDAILFDFDGVIANSEPHHVSTKKSTLDAFNIPFTEEEVSRFQGSPESHFFDYFAQANKQNSQQLLEFKRDLFNQGIDEIEEIEGVITFIRKVNHYKSCYLVTSSIRAQMSRFIDRHQLRQDFKDFITCDDVDQHKPHPEPYLACISRNNLVAARCLVIEDSPNGVISGKAAGCLVIGLIGEFSKEALLDKGAEMVVENYQELTCLLAI
mgnify:CR=1 FL=1